MNLSTNQPWSGWSLALIIALPVLVVALSEVHLRLQRRGSALAEPVDRLRIWLLPLTALLILLSKAADISGENDGLRVVATMVGVIAVTVALGLDAVLFGDAAEGTWRDRLPSIFMTLGRLILVVVVELERHGLALENMGSLPHICVGGAASTGTHGSGDANRCLAATVRAVEVVTAGGDLLVLDRSDPRFGGSVLALGRLGVMTRLELEVVPSFEVAQTVVEGLGWDALLEHLDAVMASAYSVSVFTLLPDPGTEDPEVGAGRVWLKHRTGDAEADLAALGGRALDHDVHPTPGLDPAGSTVQRGLPGRWFERLPHFSAEGAPSSSGAELQSEWYVDRVHGPAAVRALLDVAAELRPVLQVVELRTVAADDLWLSPAGPAGALGLHVTWSPEPVGVARAIAAAEAALAPFAPRPHWGKVFGLLPSEVTSRFPRWGDFVSLVDDLDPDGVFSNDFTDAYVLA